MGIPKCYTYTQKNSPSSRRRVSVLNFKIDNVETNNYPLGGINATKVQQLFKITKLYKA